MKLEIACSLRCRLRGLLGRERFSGVLLLAPCNDVHTYGMRHPLDIAFIAADGTVLEAHREVGPKRRVRCKSAVATLERFSDASRWYVSGDQVCLDMKYDQRSHI